MKSAAGEVAIGRADTDDDASTRSTGSLEVEALLAASQRDYEARRNQNNVLRLTEAIRHYSMFLESLDEDTSDEPDPNARADEVNRGAWDSIGDSIAEEEDALNAAEKIDDAVNQAHENFKSGGSYKTFSPSTNNFCRTHVAFYHVSLYLDPKQDFRKYKRDSDNKMVHGLWGFLDTARSFDLYRHTMKSRDDPDRRARSRKRTLALTTIWTSKQSMNNLHPVITSSIRGVNTYGHKMMPAYLVGKIEEPVLLAMAVRLAKDVPQRTAAPDCSLQISHQVRGKVGKGQKGRCCKGRRSPRSMERTKEAEAPRGEAAPYEQHAPQCTCDG